ncbi:MAG: hypothetical protein KAS66_10245 [Candidatus Omnitrophica bacterium]|nr:hypothetical protein [Candidatus Omnitrophota bacterium]
MNRKKIFIYLASVFVIIFFVIIRQNGVTVERNKKIISTFSEWQDNGKPVVVKRIKKEDVRLYTKITVMPVEKNEYVSYVPKIVRDKLAPGQSFFIKFGNKNAEGKVISVADEIDRGTGMFQVRLSCDNAVKSADDAMMAYVNTDVMKDVICVLNDVLDKEGGRYVLWVAHDGYAHKEIVYVKQRDGYGAIIEKGLKVGDILIVRGFTQLVENDKLNILTDSRFKEI